MTVGEQLHKVEPLITNISLQILTCKNQSYMHTHTYTAVGSVADRGQPLPWSEGAGGGRNGGRKGEMRDSPVVYREWRSN